MARLNYLPVKQGTQEWLDMRRTGITASEMPVLTGNRDGLLELWMYKTGQIDSLAPVDEATKEMFALGHAVEPVIANAYAEKTGRLVRRVNNMIRADDPPWAYASLDRITLDHSRIVELKWAAVRRWDRGVPDYVMDQVQWQMMVAQVAVTDVAVLNGGKVEIHEVVADPGYQEDLLAIARGFRHQIEERIRPDIDGSEATRRGLHRMHPVDSEPMITEPDEQMVETLDNYLRVRQAHADLTAEMKLLENRLKGSLGDHAGVSYLDARITWKKNKDQKIVDHEAISAEYLASLTPTQAIETMQKHTMTVPGSRVMRVKFNKEEGGSWM